MEKIAVLIPELSKQNSQEAWNSFVQITSDDLHKYICYYLNDQANASDILQEVYLAFLKENKVFSKIFQEHSNEIINKKVYAWLYKTARNKTFNFLKRKKNITGSQCNQLNKAEQVNPISHSNSVENKETNDLIKYELSQLNDRQQILLNLKYYLEKSNAEIAQEINCEVSSVPKLIDRALLQLKKRLEKSNICLSSTLIIEALIRKDMCLKLPPHLIPISTQLIQEALTQSVLTKSILYKGVLMKTLYMIVGTTFFFTIFIFNKPKAEDKLIKTPEKIANNPSVRNYTISPEAEKIINKALEYLSQSQHEDGYWKNEYGKNVGINSLIILAFMSMGNYPEEGYYKENVKKGVDWVISQSKSDGLIQNLKDGGGNAMYGHGFSTLMLSELWVHTRDKTVEDTLLKAIDLIIKVQGPNGSWNYYPTATDGDTSVSATQMIAICSAKKAGLKIPEKSFNKMIDLLKSRLDLKNYMYGYTSSNNNIDSNNFGCHAAATSIMQISKEKDPIYTYNPMNKNFEIIGKFKGFDSYFFYYGSISAYQESHINYYNWCDLIIPLIAAKQKETGIIADQLSTAMSVISLSIPLQYIKVYQP